MSRRSIIPLVLLVIGLLPHAVFALVHPGVLNSAAEYTLMRDKVNAGEQPWLGAFNAIPSYLNYVPTAPTSMNIVTSDFGEAAFPLWFDGDAAYGSALRWVVTGNIAHANKAREILNDWANTLTSVSGDNQRRLMISWFSPRFAITAEILKHRPGSGWTTTEQNNFRNMVYAHFVPNFQVTIPDGSTQQRNNWAAFGIYARMSYGVFLDDQAMYNAGVADFEELVRFYISNFGFSVPDGFTYETCRNGNTHGVLSGADLVHASMGLSAMSAAAEIAKKQGTLTSNGSTFYNYVGSDDNDGLRIAWLLHAPWWYAIPSSDGYGVRPGSTQSGWPCQGEFPGDPVFLKSSFHALYNHYRDSVFLSVSNFQGNVISRDSMIPWDRLTHNYFGQTSGPPLAPPVISIFSANPTAVASGFASNLSWDATGATLGCSIDQGLGQVCATATACEAGGSTSTGALTANRTFTLTCTNADGNDTAQATVTVNPVGPTINIFSASPSSIIQGQSSTLSWDASNATSGCSINQGIGTVCATATACETGGQTVVFPAADTTYRLTCVNASGSPTADTMVSVTQPQTGTLSLAYASPTGSPAAACDTPAAACDFATAATNLAAGGTLRLLDGTYTAVCDNCLPSGTASQPTIMESANVSGSPILVGPRQISVNPGMATLQSSAGIVLDIRPPAANIIVRNLGITTTGSGSAAATSFGAQTGTGQVSDILLDNLDIQAPTRTSTASCVKSYQGTSARITLKRSRIHRCGPVVNFANTSPTVHGLDLRGADHVVEDNDIYDNQAVGINLVCSGCSTSNPRAIVRHNRLYGNGGDNITIGDGDSQQVYGNAAYGSGRRGITIMPGTTRILGYQNSIHANSLQAGANVGGIRAETNVTGIIRDNIVMGHPATEIFLASNSATQIACTHNLTDSTPSTACTNTTLNTVPDDIWVDPTHATLASRNYALELGSVAIDNGTAGICLAADVSANRCTPALTLTTFEGVAPDQGALELGAPAVAELVGDYDFDNDVQDDSGVGNHGTPTSITFDPTIKIAGSHSAIFNADSDRVSIPLVGFNKDTFTIACSVQADAFGANPQYIFGHSASPPGYSEQIQLYTTSNGMLNVGLRAHPTLANAFQLVTNRFYRVVLRATEGAYKLNIDGSRIASGTYTPLTQLGATAMIGNNGGQNNEGWDGFIDECRIANYEWTEAEVSADCVANCIPGVAPFDPFALDTCELGTVAANKIICPLPNNPDPVPPCATLTDFVVTFGFTDDEDQEPLTPIPVTACVITSPTPTLTLTLAQAATATDVIHLVHAPSQSDVLVSNRLQPVFPPLMVTTCATDTSGLQIICGLVGNPNPNCEPLSNFIIQDDCGAPMAATQCTIIHGATDGTLILQRSLPPTTDQVVISLVLAVENQAVGVTNNFDPNAMPTGVEQTAWRCRPDGPDENTAWSGDANTTCAISSAGVVGVRLGVENTSGVTLEEFGTALYCARQVGGTWDTEPFVRVGTDFGTLGLKYRGPTLSGIPDQHLLTTAALPLNGGITFAPVGRYRRQEAQPSTPTLPNNQQLEEEHVLLINSGLTLGDVFVCRLHDASGTPLDGYAGLSGCTTHCGAALTVTETCP